MNVTLRATIANGDSSAERPTLIVKQSRPFVAKFDTIPAPLERIEYEASFYEYVSRLPKISAYMPRLISWIPEHYVLVIEDLGSASDATCFYDEFPKRSMPPQLPELVDWLQSLHASSREHLDVDKFRNTRLRQLNHQHIFDIPFQDPSAIDLDAVCPGLSHASAAVRRDAKLRDKSLRLGERYLSEGGPCEGDCLLHGDFYPGSWLLTAAGPRVIDPEFCFVGPAEFDLGVLLAHLNMMGCANASDGLKEQVMVGGSRPTWSLVEQFAAIEVLRRMLGVAQLPISLDLQQRMSLIAAAQESLR